MALEDRRQDRTPEIIGSGGASGDGDPPSLVIDTAEAPPAEAKGIILRSWPPISFPRIRERASSWQMEGTLRTELCYPRQLVGEDALAAQKLTSPAEVQFAARRAKLHMRQVQSY